MSEYKVKIDKKEEITIKTIDNGEDGIAINLKIMGGPNLGKEHGYSHLSKEGVDNLIAALEAVRKEINTNK